MPGSGSSAPQVYKVVNGPSKFDLANALFARQPHPLRIKMTIEVIGKREEFDLVVHAVEAEDGSGESWNIRGIAFFTDTIGPYQQKAQIHFRTDRRKGTGKFTN